MNNREDYMRVTLQLGMAQQSGRLRKDLERTTSLLKRFKKLQKEIGPAVVAILDARVTHALEEIVNNKPAPPLAIMGRDSLITVEADMLGEELVKAFRAPSRASWRDAVGDELDTWAATAPKQKAPLTHEAIPAPPADLEVTYDGERSLKVGTTTILLPVPIWRGIFEPGRLYASNDLVTRQGGMWIATAPTAETPGAGATSWILAVKGGHR